MLVPLSICISAILLCSGLAFFAGLCLGFVKSGDLDRDDLKPQVMAYAGEIADWEQPRLAEWTPELRARFKYQQERSRQLLAARRVA